MINLYYLGNFYKTPDIKIITDYLNKNNKKSCEFNEIGIDMKKKWIYLFESEGHFCYSQQNDKIEVKFEDPVNINLIIFYLSYVDGELPPRINNVSEYYDDGYIEYVILNLIIGQLFKFNS